MNRVALLAVLAAAALGRAAQTLSDADIKKLLVDRIGPDADRTGIVVGIIDPSGRRIVSYGSATEREPARPLDGDTVFGIASISKVFTSLLLADMVQKNEAALSDPLSLYLPSSVKVPERNGRVITLQDLSMHISGLPHMPTNWSPGLLNTPESVYEFLNGYTLTHDIGERFEYSSLGGGLLGHALSRKAGSTYEALLRARICKPLALASTSITLTPELQPRLAVGHSFRLEPIDHVPADVLAGAWGIFSSANDLLTFLAANIGLVKTPLAPAMAAMLVPRKSQGAEGQIALGWQVGTRFAAEGREIIWHSGSNEGYLSFAGYNPKTRTGVVVWSNANSIGIVDLGFHLLDERFKLDQTPTPRRRLQAITLNTEMLDRYTGKYEVEGTPLQDNWSGTLNLIREGNRLFVSRTAWPAGWPKMEIFAQTERQFFFKNNNILITFETEPTGKAKRLALDQNGGKLQGSRVE